MINVARLLTLIRQCLAYSASCLFCIRSAFAFAEAMLCNWDEAANYILTDQMRHMVANQKAEVATLQNTKSTHQISNLNRTNTSDKNESVRTELYKYSA